MSRWHLLNIKQLPSPCCLIFKIVLLKLKGLFMFQLTHLFPILAPLPTPQTTPQLTEFDTLATPLTPWLWAHHEKKNVNVIQA